VFGRWHHQQHAHRLQRRRRDLERRHDVNATAGSGGIEYVSGGLASAWWSTSGGFVNVSRAVSPATPIEAGARVIFSGGTTAEPDQHGPRDRVLGGIAIGNRRTGGVEIVSPAA